MRLEPRTRLIGEQMEAAGTEFNGFWLFSTRGNDMKRGLAMGGRCQRLLSA
jgi:hypothetical protein